jgi:hypothetical protein
MSGGRARRFFAALRWVLLLGGLVAMAALVRRVGPRTVLDALTAAGPFVPALIVLEAAWMGMDVFVVRALLGKRAREVPWSVYVRSAVTVYPMTILFPAGRTSAEAARAALLSPYVGAAATGLAAVLTQGASLLGNAIISLVALGVLVATLGTGHPLVAAVALSTVMTALLGALLLFGGRIPRAQALLRRVVPAGVVDLLAADRSSRAFDAVALSFAGRALQALLFIGALFATTGMLSARRGLIAQSIAVAGASFGDVVPQQAGVIEGAFAYFAGALGLGGQPDKAVATMLLIRACQISLTAITLLAGLALRGPRPREAAPAE